MLYDLGDCTQWEFMFPSNDKPQLQLPDEERFDEFEDEEVGTINIHLAKLSDSYMPLQMLLVVT